MALLSEIKCVSLPGLKTVWRITPKDVSKKEEDGDEYVCVNPQNTNLLNLIVEQNPNAPNPVPKRMTLTWSWGLQQLKKLRNDAQSATMKHAGPACTLFDAPQAKKPKMCTREENKQKRDERDAVEIEVPVGGGDTKAVRVLRPVHPKDQLYVVYEAEALNSVLLFIRESTFEEPSEYRRDMSLPPGIRKRGDGFLVAYKKSDGTGGYKMCATLEDAIASQAQIANDETLTIEAQMQAGDDEAPAASDSEAMDPSLIPS